MNTCTSELALRAVISMSLLAAGWLHMHLWSGEYRHIPMIGVAFLVQASVSFALAALIIAGAPWTLQAAAAVLSAGALAAFALSRTVGLFGFIERGWQPAPDAVLSVAAELITLGTCLILFGRRHVR